MEKAVDALKRPRKGPHRPRDPAARRRGAGPVQSYGATMPINQLGDDHRRPTRGCSSSPRGTRARIADIEQAILAAGLGLNPSNDGQIIRVPVPPLTQDRRQDLVKSSARPGRTRRSASATSAASTTSIFKTGEKDGDITEDDCRRLLEKVQASTDAAVAKVDELVTKKEEEVLEV